jgi:uncharacterized phage protein (TIGR01671 family)
MNMREILFRGKEIKTGKWVYGGFHEHKPSIVAISKQPETEALIINDGDADWNLPVPIKAYVVEKKTVGEFTGLTDRNGVKIFEGDILECERHIPNSNFNKEKFRHIVHFDKGYFYALQEYLFDKIIIGNIHDTPGLFGGDVAP